MNLVAQERYKDAIRKSGGSWKRQRRRANSAALLTAMEAEGHPRFGERIGPVESLPGSWQGTWANKKAGQEVSAEDCAIPIKSFK